MIASSATAGQPARPSSALDGALVHLGALGEARLLRVLRDHAVEGLHVLERAAHEQGVVHALAVVGEDAHRARDCAIAPISLSRSPARPAVTAPIGRTVT